MVENFGGREVQSIGIDPAVVQHQSVITSDADRCIILVVCVNIELSSVGMAKPAASVFRGGATLPTWHVDIIATEIRAGSGQTTTRRLKDWIVWAAMVAMVAIELSAFFTENWCLGSRIVKRRKGQQVRNMSNGRPEIIKEPHVEIASRAFLPALSL